MTYIHRIALSVWFLAFTGAACAANLSGTYVGLYSNAAELLQIVERPDGSILGHFEQVMLSSNGNNTTTMNAEVSGAASGATIVLTLKPAEFLGGTIPLSGSMDGDTLRLSGGANGGSFSVVAKRSTDSVFNQRVQQLIAQANQAAALHTESVAIAKDRENVVQVTKRMRAISKDAMVHVKRLAGAPAYCAGYTQKMETTLAKEGSFPSGSYARNQLDYAVSSLAFNFNLWHDDLQRVELSFGYSDGAIMLGSNLKAQIASAQGSCSAPKWAASPLCKNFSASYTNFKSTMSQLGQGFTAAETAWHAEHAKQQAIEKQADALTR